MPFFETPKIQARRHKIALMSTRTLNSDFGDLKKAMGPLGFEIDYIDNQYQFEVHFAVETNAKIAALNTLQHTLYAGRTVSVPPFLIEHVKFYQHALLSSGVDGVFSPPTESGVLFNSMLTHLSSDYPKEKTADDAPLNEQEEKYIALIKEVSIILAARSLEIPVFGSCHGAQLLWYMHGGDLYSIPDYSIDHKEGFSILEGSIMNTNHLAECDYSLMPDRSLEIASNYESETEEEDDKDYEHNLIMSTNDKNWPSFHAKQHPIMKNVHHFLSPIDDGYTDMQLKGPRFPDYQQIAKSFEFPGCIATQWHPHAYIDTNASVRYLTEFGKQCLDYQERKSSPGFSLFI